VADIIAVAAAILILCSSHTVCCGQCPDYLGFIKHTSTDMRSFIQHTGNWNTPKTADVPEHINLKLAPSDPKPALWFCLHL
jgi:hypothetical protein